MKSSLILLGIVLFGSLAAAYFFLAPPSVEPPSVESQQSQEQNGGGGLTLTSDAFVHNQPIPAAYTCDGKNVHPPLVVSNAPEKTKSFALIVDDPDAPLGTWVHWVLWNMPPDTKEIDEGFVPVGSTQGTTSAGDSEYKGPCPPTGTHRYFFKLYALDSTIGLDGKGKAEDLEEAMKGHILSETSLVGTYVRSR